MDERIREIVAAERPSEVLERLRAKGELPPELAALVGVQQEREWHPEGDVWVHTCQVVDMARRITTRLGTPREQADLVVLGALCHDLGKPAATAFENGRWRSLEHEAAGEAPTRSLLGDDPSVERVVALVLDHLKPVQLITKGGGVHKRAVRRLQQRVAERGATIEDLVLVSWADQFGRVDAKNSLGIDPDGPFKAGEVVLEKAREVEDEPVLPEPLLRGRDLIDAGKQPSPVFGKVLDEVFTAQLEGKVTTREEALALALRLLG